MHVLVIEDEPLLALDIQYFLESLGAESVAIAPTEGDALSAACDHRPDLITADFALSDGTGPGAVRRIRHRVGEIPVIYVTGQPASCLAEDAAADIVAKPILWLQFAQAVSRHNLPPA